MYQGGSTVRKGQLAELLESRVPQATRDKLLLPFRFPSRLAKASENRLEYY
jgi:hypothetical protein